ncbi:hypothetical protein THIOM_004902 [Candidatus Thiomargarita nelsonii]|uniref:Uncharacterized protein n=1 Tax=Candidatus Thiomargarita nelsonii TaxID=1003181 RepID=A0A176RUP5_9GAMM|nr:hypothetical protein THIOM_004902 [Candidatus Thiomargarita nelsonii]
MLKCRLFLSTCRYLSMKLLSQDRLKRVFYLIINSGKLLLILVSCVCQSDIMENNLCHLKKDKKNQSANS